MIFDDVNGAGQPATIPENYFCHWNLDLIETSFYEIALFRSYNFVEEQIQINIQSSSGDVNLTDN